jgi:hypothetical protein
MTLVKHEFPLNTNFYLWILKIVKHKFGDQIANVLLYLQRVRPKKSPHYLLRFNHVRNSKQQVMFKAVKMLNAVG